MSSGGLKPNPTQSQRVLDVLRESRGGWVDGMVFLRMAHPITQYHARIWELQRKGHVIEGRFVGDKNWKEYRLVSEVMEETASKSFDREKVIPASASQQNGQGTLFQLPAPAYQH